MKTLLHIEASPRVTRSHSRRLGADYAAAWQAARPGSKVITHDLVLNPPPFVSEAWVAGAYNPPENRAPNEKSAIAVSDQYIDEVFAADEIVISTPIYNLSLPAALKAWIDQIVRYGRTFTRNGSGFEGLIKGKKVTVIVASGSDFRPGTPGGAYNHLEPYLRAVFGFVGMTDLRFVYAHSLNDDSPQRQAVLTEATSALRQFAAAA
ncbi:MAG: NAD(P)H-dependent oxidoreductase [Nibricoccus sp.]